jgi:methylmalonyl-CoA/ethylmalonyl-CoA epimerase
MIKGLSHIGVIVEDLEAATKLWTETFGLIKYDEMVVEVEGIRNVMLSVGGTADEMSIELIEPLDKTDMSNALARRLANSGEGFYHLAVHVGDEVATGQELRDAGLQVFDRPAISADYTPRWLTHPKSSSGVMVEGMGEV